jgi:hypothetical protein
MVALRTALSPSPVDSQVGADDDAPPVATAPISVSQVHGSMMRTKLRSTRTRLSIPRPRLERLRSRQTFLHHEAFAHHGPTLP